MQFLFETARLQARNFDLNDIKLLNELHGDEILMKTTSGSPQTIAETEKEIREIIAQQQKYQVTQLAFFDKSQNFVGRCGIIYRAFENENDLNYELRYAIHRHFQGGGYGSEMAQGYLDYVFSTANNIQNVIAAVRLDGHEASSKILQKLHFKYIGNKVFHSNKKECRIWEIAREGWDKK